MAAAIPCPADTGIGGCAVEDEIGSANLPGFPRRLIFILDDEISAGRVSDRASEHFPRALGAFDYPNAFFLPNRPAFPESIADTALVLDEHYIRLPATWARQG